MAEVLVDFVERVRDLLAERFSGATIEIDRYYGSEKVSGHILWEGFEDVEQLERQSAIYEALRNALGPEARGISIILAYTPREWELMGED